ncbi:MAG: glycosyltransferase family 2 protein [Dysgonamonadaceae bacterium]|jgi:GT2 family glycosyltransferase|nr:glycosyltransferase family 2 protein [Dysgonamonadaceae bacterium]
MKRIGIVILNWNGKSLLEKFLPSIVKYTDLTVADIVVADNGSKDDSMPFLTAHYPFIRQIVFDKNYGFAEGYNKALASLNYEYTVLLNSDVEVGSNWLTIAIDYLDDHDDVVAVQPKLLSYNDKSSFEYAGASGGFIDMYGYPFCRGRVFTSLEKDCMQYDNPVDVLWASGACLIIRLEEYKKAGGFDDYFFAHQEEIDLCWRLRARGKRIVCLPQSVVYHVGGATLKMEHPKKTFLNFRNNLLMLYKNLPEKYYWRVMCFRFFADYFAFLYLFLKGWRPNAIAILKARHDFYNQKKKYKAIRKKNLEQSQTELPPEILKKPLLWIYHIFPRAKVFRSIHWGAKN